jgi:DNA invertase Pin-like site-specific DNA recombinase
MAPFKKILGYSRVSTTEQASDDRTSLQTQEREIRGSAMIRGVDCVEIYSDPGVSGSIPLAERPAGARLVAALEPGTLVVASKLDRIFRSASDALSTVERWKAQGIDLILVDCGTEPVSANGNSKLFFGILASVAEFEKGRIAERMREGRKGKAERGGHIGGLPPYGFRKVGHGRGAMLEIDPAGHATIASIKQLRDQGASASARSLRSLPPTASC